MVSSVLNSVFSLLASRNQQYIMAVTTAQWHTTHAHIQWLYYCYYFYYYYYYYYYYFGKIIQNKIYICYKNQAQLQKAGQQKMIKTNNGILY